jgi:3-oxoacyl-ACP reductase-like protein
MAKKKIEVTNAVIQEPKMEIADGLDRQAEVATGSTSKNLIQEIEEMRASGQVGTDEFVQKMRELEVLLGVSEISPFGTNELEIFEDNLKEMSLAEMQKLAQKVGLNPFHDRPTLKNILIKEFKASTRNSRRNIMPTSMDSFKIDPNNPKHQELLKIINDI